MMLLIWVLLLGLLSSPALAQNKSAAGTLVVPQDDGRDPFSATRKMVRKGRDTIKDALDLPSQTTPSRVTGGLPTFQLRGFIDAPEHRPRALIEVAGSGVYLVKQGDKVSIPVGGKLHDLRVQSVSKLSIRIRVSGQTVIVR